MPDRSETELPAAAWRPVGSAAAVLGIVLTGASNGYGFHRDELYFRALPAAWGYVDQPPLTPLLAHAFGHLSASPWALRIPATLAAMASVLVLALITREMGGGGLAQGLCAWAYALASTPLVMGHVLLTASLDLVIWPSACLFLIRVLLRRRPRWWPAVGGTVGLATYNKLLIVLLVVALGAGLLIVGPRSVLRSRWFLAAVLIAAVLALPNLLYQATHSWPQISMGRALSDNNAGEIRILMWPYLLLLLGPPLVPIWVAGLLALRSRPAWRPVKFLVVAFGVVLLETFAGGGQFYYPLGLLTVIFAIGCVPAADLLGRSPAWRRLTVVGVALNAAVSAVIALPVLPLSALAASPVPAINQTAGDQVGWPEYVRQIATVYQHLPASDRQHAVIIASNYGEAGALDRYGPALGLPHPYSGHNQLYFQARPPEVTRTVVIIGGQLPLAREHFASCTVAARLHNDANVDNEEQGEPVAVCREPEQRWPSLWQVFQHYD
ncbi:MAG: glycosyltransferase family 39 protein [Pseudonocardiales bacterium]